MKPVAKIYKSSIARSKKWLNFLSTLLNAVPVEIGVLIKFSLSSSHFSLTYYNINDPLCMTV